MRTVVELVIADQATERLTAELTELLLIHLLEDRALVPGTALVMTEGTSQFLLADVHHPDAQVGADFGIGDQIVQATPRTFELLHVGVMKDLGQLLGNLGVNFCNKLVYRFQNVLVDNNLVTTNELEECTDGRLDCIGSLIGPRPEGFLQ